MEDHGVSANAADQWGRMALYVAAHAGSAEALKMFVQHRDCRVNATVGWERLTALYAAAAAGSAKAVQMLVQHPDCRVNTTNKICGCTALHRAAEAGQAEAVNVLASHPRCDFSITDRFGDTAADVARHERHDDIAELIERKSKGKFVKSAWSA